MKDFKIRCSAIGSIMTEPKNKKDFLSKTAQTYCQTWCKEQLYNRKKEFSNKYTQKGNIVEDNSIDFVAEYLNLGMLIKNEQHFENDFLTGTPDVVLKDLLIDVKNSWDVFTFPLFDTECPNTDYYWQAQGYMALTGKNSYKLIYTLIDTPENLIESEMRKYCFQNGIEQDDADYKEWFDKMTYKDIPNDLKIKIFEIQRNDEDIKRIENRVVECRLYIKYIKSNNLTI